MGGGLVGVCQVPPDRAHLSSRRSLRFRVLDPKHPENPCSWKRILGGNSAIPFRLLLPYMAHTSPQYLYFIQVPLPSLLILKELFSWSHAIARGWIQIRHYPM